MWFRNDLSATNDMNYCWIASIVVTWFSLCSLVIIERKGVKSEYNPKLFTIEQWQRHNLRVNEYLRKALN